jgi:hypothetical protein
MISTDLIGRMGNQMFQYSICRLIADKNGYNFHIPTNGEESCEGHHLSKFFPNIDLGVIDGNIKNTYQDNNEYNPDILNLTDFTKVRGFFQCGNYYDNDHDKIKKWFDVKIDDVTKTLVTKYPINEYCFIHVRGTDYINSQNWFLSRKYYLESIEEVKKINKDIKFVVITDDINSTNNILPELDIISNDMMVDFKLLHLSKYCIISNSTFSWWAAWLSDKEIIIAPNNWLNYNNQQLGSFPLHIQTNRFKFI